MLDLDKCGIPHFHETLKINMSLMIANETVGSYLYRIIKGQNTTNIVFIRHSTFHAYLGFDTLILASRFWDLVSLTYQGYDTLIPAPRFWHLVFSYMSLAIITQFQNRLIFILHISTTMSLMIEKRTIDFSKNFQKVEHNKFFITHSYILGSWSLQ